MDARQWDTEGEAPSRGEAAHITQVLETAQRIRLPRGGVSRRGVVLGERAADPDEPAGLRMVEDGSRCRCRDDGHRAFVRLPVALLAHGGFRVAGPQQLRQDEGVQRVGIAFVHDLDRQVPHPAQLRRSSSRSLPASNRFTAGSCVSAAGAHPLAGLHSGGAIAIVGGRGTGRHGYGGT
ncbi:hypothetical protein [Streptomyces sp. NPDC059616]|uniref:hypothetical protein n=1 Tax=Streptomyces sp. NPDC059616 TaxID=3346886 RepID=UPI00368148DA